MKRALILALICIQFASLPAMSQSRRRRPQKPPAQPSSTYVLKQQAEIRAGRERIATQIKALTQFVYLLAGIAKTIEIAEQVNRNKEESSLSVSDKEIERNKARLKENFRAVRLGLDQLENGFRYNPALQTYYPTLAGVAKMGQMAESQAGANHFDQAAASLISAVNKLADVLATTLTFTLPTR